MPANTPSSGMPARAATRTPSSTLVSRNVTISSHRTSIRLEPEMWSALSEICRREGNSLHHICTAVASRKGEHTSLTAAIRVFVMAYYRAAATEEGHIKVGHGYGMNARASDGRDNQSRAAPPAPVPSTVSTYDNRAPTNGSRGGIR